LRDYYDYLLWQKDNDWMPIPSDAKDYFFHYEEWLEVEDLFKAGYTREQIDGYRDDYIRFKAFADKYAQLNDYQPSGFGDFITNYGQSQQQLDLWVGKAGPEATGFTDDQIRAYKDYQQWYYEYGKPGDWMPVDVGDFITNQAKAQEQQAVWQGLAEEVDEYALDPAEAARRREEAYAEGRVAAGERYHKTPEYLQAFSPWLEEQGQFSGALAAFTEKQYSSLASRFKATQPALTGFPTPEAARAEKARRESQFQAWLPGQMPGVEQKYWGQTPLMRGERPYMYQPPMRTVNW